MSVFTTGAVTDAVDEAVLLVFDAVVVLVLAVLVEITLVVVVLTLAEEKVEEELELVVADEVVLPNLGRFGMYSEIGIVEEYWMLPPTKVVFVMGVVVP